MPFPKLKFHVIQGGQTSPIIEQITDEETGIITEKTKPCNEKLPDASYFKIENQIKAGITLNEVNTNVITSNTPSQTADIVTKITNKPNKNEENE